MNSVKDIYMYLENTYHFKPINERPSKRPSKSRQFLLKSMQNSQNIESPISLLLTLDLILEKKIKMHSLFYYIFNLQ